MNKFDKVCAEMRKNKIDVALITSPCNITYLTGFEMPYYKTFMESIARDIPMAVLFINAKNSAKVLIVSDFYSMKIKRSAAAGEATFFSTYDPFINRNPLTGLLSVVREVLVDELPKHAGATIGIEQETCPYMLTEMITGIFKDVQIEDMHQCLYHARKIKTSDEIALIRKAAALSDECQNTLLEVAGSGRNAGQTELDVWEKVYGRICRKVDHIVPFVGELVTGLRTGLNDYPLGPKNRVIEKGDMGIMDICPRLNGYWADCSNVVVFYDEPNALQKKYFKAVREAFDAAVDALIPGNRCYDVDAAARKAFEANGFAAVSYIGHCIGVEVNERPRITCYDNTVIEPGMVFCLEPQQYTGPSGDTGARIEKMVLVTDSGPEIINQFQWGI